jgi:FKBP-type peptidyl-prolyl cis-trans isomerase FklB
VLAMKVVAMIAKPSVLSFTRWSPSRGPVPSGRTHSSDGSPDKGGCGDGQRSLYGVTMIKPLLAAVVTLAVLGPASVLAASAPLSSDKSIVMPGISYQILASGPVTGAHPTRADSVSMRYIGRLTNGDVFSTSPGDGRGLSVFPVKEVIPGMSAALQLMRAGDHWRITMPPYLAYGPGRPFTPPAAGPVTGPAAQVTQMRGIPPEATLIFDVELEAILPTKSP